MKTQIDHAYNFIPTIRKLDVTPVKQASTSNVSAERPVLSGEWAKLSNVLRRSAGGCSKSRTRSL